MPLFANKLSSVAAKDNVLFIPEVPPGITRFSDCGDSFAWSSALSTDSSAASGAAQVYLRASNETHRGAVGETRTWESVGPWGDCVILFEPVL
jgi:hypothetical protein